MNRCMWTVMALVVGVLGVSVASADIFTFQPTPPDLNDLAHAKYYKWGISWSIPTGDYISGANLFIDNINDYTVESGDRLYVHLLDNPSVGTFSYSDTTGGNQFTGEGRWLFTYTDDDWWPNPPEDVSYTFTATDLVYLTSYAGNGVFGLGFDPDCHYYNCGVTLTVQTEPVPAPGAVLLGALGLGLVGGVRRRLSLRPV